MGIIKIYMCNKVQESIYGDYLYRHRYLFIIAWSASFFCLTTFLFLFLSVKKFLSPLFLASKSNTIDELNEKWFSTKSPRQHISKEEKDLPTEMDAVKMNNPGISRIFCFI